MSHSLVTSTVTSREEMFCSPHRVKNKKQSTNQIGFDLCSWFVFEFYALYLLTVVIICCWPNVQIVVLIIRFSHFGIDVKWST